MRIQDRHWPVVARRPRLANVAATRALAMVIAMTACGGDGPTDTPDGPASITVVSAVDTVIAVGGVAQLSATGKNAAGGVIGGLTFTWSSSNAGVANVSQSGAVTGIAAGTTTITASSGGMSGALLLRVASPDLAGVSTLLNDPYHAALNGALSTPIRTQVQAALGGCTTGLSGGNLLAIHTCLVTLQGVTGTSGDDVALLAVSNLFWDLSRTSLAFGR